MLNLIHLDDNNLDPKNINPDFLEGPLLDDNNSDVPKPQQNKSSKPTVKKYAKYLGNPYGSKCLLNRVINSDKFR